jgi:HrpA-like RNA helicase
VPDNLSTDQYEIVLWLVRSQGKLGTGVLVFVSGIRDIEKLYEKFEGLTRFKLYAIHSDIPFEEQEEAFLPCGPDEVKVVIATNAAESSITLPDVDIVICLGTHKALRYNPSTHRVHLLNTWISKASATQRAGRTGRVRPGSVYRIYSKELFFKFQEHEESEVLRRTLQEVILKLWTMLEER